MSKMVKQMGGPNGFLSNMQKAQAQQGNRRGPLSANPLAGMPDMGGMQEMMSKMMGGSMPDLGALSKMMGPNGMPDFGALANMMGGQGAGGLAEMMSSMMGGGGAPAMPALKPKMQRVKRK
jgi:hypothetical protein